MAWPNPFHKTTPNTRTCWGYTFDLGPDHLTPEKAHPLKYSYDTLGEEALDALNELFPPESLVQHPPLKQNKDKDNGSEKHDHDNGPTVPVPVPTNKTKPKRDLYALLKDNHTKHPKLQELWDEVTTIPEWVDWPQIARGQDVFYRYGGATLTGLAYQSLLGGMGANRVVEVLARTGGFGVNVARHRLFETTQHILECTRSLESIQPGGAGFSSSLRVRLLHASVRQRILKLAKTRPGYYSVEEYGVPINDLDSIATIGTFSGTIIWLSLPRQGIFLRQQEIDDYIALWRLIAHYVGTPTEYFAHPGKAKSMMESLLMNEINPSQTSQTLANNVIRCLENQPPAYATRSFLEASARWLNGDELCDALGLGVPKLYHRCLVAGQCVFFMLICYTYRSVPWLDRRKIANLKTIFWQVIVESKYGLGGEQTVFDFKYIPQFDTVTYKGADEELMHKERGAVESRNLGALAFGTVFLGVVSYLGVKTTLILARGVWHAEEKAVVSETGLSYSLLTLLPPSLACFASALVCCVVANTALIAKNVDENERDEVQHLLSVVYVPIETMPRAKDTQMKAQETRLPIVPRVNFINRLREYMLPRVANGKLAINLKKSGSSPSACSIICGCHAVVFSKAYGGGVRELQN